MKKLVSLLLALCLVLGVAAALAEKDTLTIGTAAEATKFFASSKDGSNNNDYVVVINNLYNTLVNLNAEGQIEPALATEYTVSEDGLTYTFTLRKGVKWVNSKGQEVAEVKADDFVAGFQHMLDATGGLEYLVEGVIVNAAEYNAKAVTFDKVGVKKLMARS